MILLLGHASMPEDRSYHTGVLYKGNYVICGGKQGKTALNTCIEYDVKNDNWIRWDHNMTVDR